MPESRKNVTILGSTGSIGRNTLEVIGRHNDLYGVFALTADTNIQQLLEQCHQFEPRFAVLQNTDAALQLAELMAEQGAKTTVLGGLEGLLEVASHSECDYVMAAIVGAAGLKPTLAAVESGKRVLLANKEALVMSGALFMDAVKKSGAEVLPIDSEHNAIFQCLPDGFKTKDIRRILLTGSGGPLLREPLDQLKYVLPDRACAHPNWKMGRKISVDSATMMNKGLELIEANWLFDVKMDRIEVIIHPQSIVHSMVEYQDGSILAQLGSPDMRTPIAHGLAWPNRIDSGVASLDFSALGQLLFESVDMERYPCLRLAMEVLAAGGSLPTVLNAANEVAVQAYLDELICFTDIPVIIESVLERSDTPAAHSIEEILEIDRITRRSAQGMIETAHRSQ
ncbi:MAG: 1-deoxy-D-xylulose-5-phosphate reductoisomerase [Pseudomonadales bacterium]|jgi:1-deoxy-D-xylulose-5-phosphate reductoisomerase|nr:1-deoxy-D-xylulose-5-phosphate reductoisomerase [Pseudomonadales bacterium]MDP7357748.1 1-deoxy-D-xylulose-5-phosphate reductoisomerase [Pseudomonadales bacterium]MDP7596193.1 1-deoxy-D-xylulose-5-phosphate reductoisomerase [Pseudomonadales bacterium]HJN50451.1 1-deoxy-D-xylulose-5-phosphate reductoisomerase [Pseudomonadales bacterium]|tara:strand:- start:9349 stop:10536 length:1188 start_codon:yes stop_codon:yes gene_type:complete